MAHFSLNRHIDFGIAISGLPLTKTYTAALYSKTSGKRMRTEGVVDGSKHKFIWEHTDTQNLPEGNYALEIYADDQSLMGFVIDFVFVRKTNFDGEDI